MVDRRTLLNAFQPATEVDEPERFAGRELQVRELSDSLHIAGSVPLIFGDRGLGKSSLALQLRRIAMGDVELLSLLKAQDLALLSDQCFLTIAVTCTDATRDFGDLLQLLINAAENLDTIPVNSKGKARILVDRTTRRKVSIKLIELEDTKRYKTAGKDLRRESLSGEEKLVQLCDLLMRIYGQPVLFIVDELDRMKETLGLASFLKAVSGSALKFVLVGIASTVSDLLADHQSLERRLVPVRVPLMTPPELDQISIKAEKYLERQNIDIQFGNESILKLSSVAAGFPWFVHVLGQQCLVDAAAANRSLISPSQVQKAIESIVENQFAQQFADMYQMAVRDSSKREITLRMFANWTSQDVPTGEIYRILSDRLGVLRGSAYRGQLCTPIFGSVLFAPAFQRRGLVRFRNEMFKAYIRMRPSIYHGVDDRVSTAWLAHMELRSRPT